MADLDAVLARAKTRDHTAFAALVRNYQALVFSSALHFFRNAAWAEEIAQEIFLELYRSIEDIASVDHLTAWLRRSTLCRCIDLSRKRKYRAEVSLEESGPAAVRASFSDVYALDRVRRQVAALPENQRAVVILRYGEDLEPMEIATLLDLPVNTVKSRLHRALETLRGRLRNTLSKTASEAV